MKKLLSMMMMIFVLTPILSGCDISLSKDDEEKDKLIEELQSKVDELENKTDAEKTEEEVKPDETKTEEPKTEDPKTEDPDEEEPVVPAYDGPNYITINSPLNDFSSHEEPIVFTGSVSPNTTKIVVTAKAMVMGAKEDVYRLQNFDYGDDTFTYRAKIEYNNLGYGTNNFEFKAYFDDGTTKTDAVTVYFLEPGAEMGKPVIYLYPEETTKVSVNVEPTGGVSISIPEIGEGWDVIATPSGTLFNFGDFQLYPYLFWEGFAYSFVTPEEGFVVAKDDVVSFFEDKLSYLGLNEKEIADFGEFWFPRLAEDPYYFITFIPQEEFDKYAPLTVTPEADTIIRVFFDYQGLDEEIEVTPQTLIKGVREGFTVIEWGGRLYR